MKYFIVKYSSLAYEYLLPAYHKALVKFQAQREKLRLIWQKIRVKSQPLLEQAQERWLSFADREKRIIAGVGLVIALLIFYSLIWSPLANKVELLRGQIKREQKTLSWIKQADKKLNALEKKQTTIPQSSLVLQLNSLQEKIQKSPLSANLSQLTQVSAKEIHCSFTNVDFDKLMAWLLELSQQEDFTLSQVAIQRGNSPSIVQAEFLLSL